MLNNRVSAHLFDNRQEEFKIADEKTRQQWEKLLGFPIRSDRVRLTRTLYEKHARAIQAIQLSSAFRNRRS